MSESARFDAEKVGANYAKGSANVESRFRLYAFAEKPIDFHDLINESLALQGDETIVDVGCSAGEYLLSLRYAPNNHRGQLIGVDPYIMQFPHPMKATDAGVTFLQGWAECLPLENDSADVLSHQFMRYHVPERKQQAATDEAKRVLKPDGIYVQSTSGDYNKVRHRVLEAMTGRRLHREPPAYMNAGYDTEVAMADLPKQFANVLHFKQHTLMILTAKYQVETYMASFRSLYNQYDPPILEADPDYEQVIAAETIIENIIRNEMKQRGQFLDYIMRDLFICSDAPLIIHNANGFEDISKAV